MGTMKFNLASAACVLLILCNAVFGQEVKKVQEPEYLGIFFLLDSSTGNLVPLERQTAESKVKVKAMGFGGAKSTIEIKGESLLLGSKKVKT
jgi:hypothetical protein